MKKVSVEAIAAALVHPRAKDNAKLISKLRLGDDFRICPLESGRYYINILLSDDADVSAIDIKWEKDRKVNVLKKTENSSFSRKWGSYNPYTKYQWYRQWLFHTTADNFDIEFKFHKILKETEEIHGNIINIKQMKNLAKDGIEFVESTKAFHGDLKGLTKTCYGLKWKGKTIFNSKSRWALTAQNGSSSITGSFPKMYGPGVFMNTLYEKINIAWEKKKEEKQAKSQFKAALKSCDKDYKFKLIDVMKYFKFCPGGTEDFLWSIGIRYDPYMTMSFNEIKEAWSNTAGYSKKCLCDEYGYELLKLEKVFGKL